MRPAGTSCRSTQRGRGNGANYGLFEAAVWVTAGKTAVLPYTIWLPKIDTARAVKIDSPTQSESIVTTPLIPGLELRIPAGAVITDKDGRVAREISITPIPVDQPPFPLPDGVDVPIYFTIQPGGASVAVPGSSGYQRGARLNYPNYGQRQPGAPAEFWQYEPEDGRGWYVYGRGAVTADGCQVAPNPGVSIHAFTGAMFGPPAFGGGPGEAPAIIRDMVVTRCIWGPACPRSSTRPFVHLRRPWPSVAPAGSRHAGLQGHICRGEPERVMRTPLAGHRRSFTR